MPPYCEKINNYITDGVSLPFGKIVIFEKDCFHCKNKIKYQAKWEIEIIAESDDQW